MSSIKVEITRKAIVGAGRIFVKTPEGYVLAFNVSKKWEVPGCMIEKDRLAEVAAAECFERMSGYMIDVAKLRELNIPELPVSDNVLDRTHYYVYDIPVPLSELKINTTTVSLTPVSLHVLSHLENWTYLELYLREWLYG